MEIDEFRGALVASIAMLVVSLCLAYMRVSGTPIFEAFFESCLFYLPTAILIGYAAYLKFRRSAPVS
ncbi:MAG: hypothetical protein ABC585_01815 [Candidatus Methanosuratincola petrocarbonis]|nr:hypothetical protein [Candidatus Methanosuratincola sp.]